MIDDDEHDYFEYWPGPTDNFRENWYKLMNNLGVQATTYVRAMGKVLQQLAVVTENAQFNSVKIHESFGSFAKHETSCKPSSMPRKKNLKYPGTPARGQFPKRGL